MLYPAGLEKLSPRQLEGRGARASEMPLSAPPAPPWPFLPPLPVGSAGPGGRLSPRRGEEGTEPRRGTARLVRTPGTQLIRRPPLAPGPPGPRAHPVFQARAALLILAQQARLHLPPAPLPSCPCPAPPSLPGLARRSPRLQAPDCGSRPGTRRLGTGRADVRRRRCRGRHFASNGLLQPPALRGQPDGKFMPRRRGCRGGAAAAVGARSGRRVLRRLPGPRPWGVSGRTD